MSPDPVKKVESMSAIALSRSIQVREFVTLLFGGETTVKELSTEILPAETGAIACFSNLDGQLRHAIVCDYSFANSAGAALSLITPAFIAQPIKRRQIEDNIADNLREVLNIAVNLFATSDGEGLRLDSVVLQPRDQTMLPAVTARHRFEVAIPRYPAGRIDLLDLSTDSPG
jgi:hypothetical protein